MTEALRQAAQAAHDALEATLVNNAWPAVIRGLQVQAVKDLRAALAQPVQQAGAEPEHIAEVMSGWVLAWANKEPIAHLLARHPGVRIGSKLYAQAAPAQRQPLTDAATNVLLQAIQRLNQNPYSLTKSECLDVLQALRDEFSSPNTGEAPHGS